MHKSQDISAKVLCLQDARQTFCLRLTCPPGDWKDCHDTVHIVVLMAVFEYTDEAKTTSHFCLKILNLFLFHPLPEPKTAAFPLPCNTLRSFRITRVPCPPCAVHGTRKTQKLSNVCNLLSNVREAVQSYLYLTFFRLILVPSDGFNFFGQTIMVSSYCFYY